MSAGAQGTDLLTGVEKVTDGAGHHFLLVGNGGYATIQAAVDAAAVGDTILVGAGTFAGATIGKELTIIGQGAGQTIITSGAGQTGFQLTGNIDATAGDAHATVTIQGFTFTGNSVGVGVASSTTLLDHLVVENSDFTGNTIHGVGTGSGAFGVKAVDITNSTFEHNGDGSHNGDGDIVLFGFTGDALIKNVTITGGANATPTNANADTGIQINGRNPTSYDVTQPIGHVVFDNVSVTGSYAKVLVYIQGYTDLDGLSFLNSGTTINGHAGWGWALAIDPTADRTSAATPGVPGEPGFFDDAAAGALAPDTVDLSHVTVTNDTPVNVTVGHPLFAFNGTALGTVFSGTPVAMSSPALTVSTCSSDAAAMTSFMPAAATTVPLHRRRRRRHDRRRHRHRYPLRVGDGRQRQHRRRRQRLGRGHLDRGHVPDRGRAIHRRRRRRHRHAQLHRHGQRGDRQPRHRQRDRPYVGDRDRERHRRQRQRYAHR